MEILQNAINYITPIYQIWLRSKVALVHSEKTFVFFIHISEQCVQATSFQISFNLPVPNLLLIICKPGC